ncbi:MAG: DNA glycosylase [Actinobacteria bacterium]|nr:DNA glycosylase [Actinomycetota bacterium]
MPEGDSLHRAAARLQPLVGETLAVEAHHPRAQVLRIAEEIDGKRLEGVKAVGKNLLLTFEGGLVLRSHLRMTGRWGIRPSGADVRGRPWLVLRGREHQGVLWNGAVLQLARRHPQVERLGPDVMLDPPDLDGMVARLRATDKEREVGDALLDQRLVAGIGNMWKAEGLFLAGQSPWSRLHEVSDEELRRVLDETSRAMRATRRQRHLVYGRVGLPCRRCNALIDAWRQGDDARTAFWCPSCQAGPREPRRLRIRSNKL